MEFSRQEYWSGMEGEGKMYGERNVETYTIICEVDSQWEFAIWLRELKGGLCDNQEGWDGEGDGREVQEEGDICIPMAEEALGVGDQQEGLACCDSWGHKELDTTQWLKWIDGWFMLMFDRKQQNSVKQLSFN